MCQEGTEFKYLKEIFEKGEESNASLQLLDKFAKELLKSNPKTENDATQIVMEVMSKSNSLTADDDFHKGEVIGQGEFGRVWKGRWRGGDCAIKELLPPENPHNASAARISKQRDIFSKEIIQLQSMRHANIVQYYGCVIRGDSMFLLTEYVDGGSLSGWLQQQRASGHRLTLHEALRIAEDVAVGLNVMHCSGYVHCDIACRNMLRGKDVCKVADLGIAQKMINGKAPISIYPILWTSPETITQKKASVNSDIWMYGILLWELFSYCFSNPFTDYDEGTSDFETLVLAIRNGVARLRQPRGCPDEVYDCLIRACLEIDEVKRPTMQAILSKIRRLSGDQFISKSLIPLPDDYVDHTGLMTMSTANEAFHCRLLSATPNLDFSGLSLNKEIRRVVTSLLHIHHTSIDLSNNNIDDEGCQAIAEAVSSHKLISIDLRNNNNITPVGMTYLRSSQACAVKYRVSVSDFGRSKKVVNLKKAVTSMCFDEACGNRLVTWEAASDTLQLWNTNTISESTSLTLKACPFVRSASWDCAGNRLAASCAGERHDISFSRVLIWEPSYGSKTPYIIESNTAYVNHCFHPRIENFLTVFTSGNAYTIYNVAFKSAIISMTVPCLTRKCVPRFVKIYTPESEDSSELLVWGTTKKLTVNYLPTNSDEGIVIKDFADKKKSFGPPVVIKKPHRYEMTDVQLSPLKDYLQIATCGSDGVIHIWNGGGVRTHSFKRNDSRAAVSSLVWSTDGKVLFTATDRITAWSVETQSKLNNFTILHEDNITKLAVDRISGELATCSSDGLIVFWSCNSESEIQSERPLPEVPPLPSSPSDRSLPLTYDYATVEHCYDDNYKYSVVGNSD